MDSQQARGRSPSQGNKHISPGPSPHRYHDAASALDPAISENTFTTGRFNTSPHFTTPFLQQTSQSSLVNPNFYSSLNQNPFRDNQIQDQSLDPSFNNDFMYQNALSGEFPPDFPLNANFNMNQHANVNPADLNKLSPPQDHTSPHLLPPDDHSSPGQAGSPASTNGQYYTPQHSRHASLDPFSAYGVADWQGTTFQQHRRANSDQSDISSNAPSPFLQQRESFDDPSRSPFMPPQPDDSNTFGLDSFSIGEQSHGAQQHANYVSPRLLPAQSQGLGIAQEGMMAQTNVALHVAQGFPNQADSGFQTAAMHGRNVSTTSEIGQADHFAPPTIQIDPAPISRQASFGPNAGNIANSLSPPSRQFPLPSPLLVLEY